ncbi:MAG: hypothetical protein ACOZAQ_08820 [Pseudomonadota bacterium]
MGQREAWAEYAARLMGEGQGLDCEAAKRRAAEALGLSAGHDEPGCDEVEACLRAYQRLFRPGQPAVARRMREEALKAMRFLADFEPRLVGAVLSGTADEGGVITIHLFADTPEQVMLKLLDADIGFREGERGVRYRDGRTRIYPLFSFLAGGCPIDLVVMPPMALREPPAGYGEGGVMPRASLRKVERLLVAEAPNEDS